MLLGATGGWTDGPSEVIDDDDLEMSDDAILRAAAEAEEGGWIMLCGELQVVIDGSPDRAGAVVHVARQIPSLKRADGLEGTVPSSFTGGDLMESLSAEDQHALLLLRATPIVPFSPDRGL